MPSNKKFGYSNCAYFSNGTYVCGWFKVNKKKIFNLNNDVSKKIMSEYEEYLLIATEKEKEKMKTIKEKIDKFNDYCTLFYNIKDYKKYEENSNITLVNDLLAYDWFNYYKTRISLSTLDICKLIMKDYNNYKKYKGKQKQVEKQRKVQEFYLQSGYDKFNKNSKLKFKDGQLMTEWFYDNFDYILSSDNVIATFIKKQYDMFLCICLLKKEFIDNPNLEKFDEFSNVRFNSGALMSDFFYSNFKQISNSNDRLDCIIMSEYNKYIMIKDLYYDEEDLVIKKY